MLTIQQSNEQRNIICPPCISVRVSVLYGGIQRPVRVSTDTECIITDLKTSKPNIHMNDFRQWIMSTGYINQCVRSSCAVGIKWYRPSQTEANKLTQPTYESHLVYVTLPVVVLRLFKCQESLIQWSHVTFKISILLHVCTLNHDHSGSSVKALLLFLSQPVAPPALLRQN